MEVRRYLEGHGDSFDEAFAETLPMWQDSETRELWSWIRSFNRVHPNDPVRFYGVDCQLVLEPGPSEGAPPRVSAARRLRALLKAPPEIAGAIDAAEDALRAHAFRSDAPLSEIDETIAARNEAALRTAGLRQAVAAARPALVARAGAGAVRLAELYVRAMEEMPHASSAFSFALFTGGAPMPALEAAAAKAGTTLEDEIYGRNRGMARIVEAVLTAEADARGSEARAVLWAHNAHVSRHDQLAERLFGKRLPDLGGFLSTRFGAGYFGLLTEARRGRFTAFSESEESAESARPVSYPPLAEGAFAALFDGARLPLLVRFRRGEEAVELPPALQGTFVMTYGTGSAPDDEAGIAERVRVPVELPAAADAILLFDEVEAADWHLRTRRP